MMRFLRVLPCAAVLIAVLAPTVRATTPAPPPTGVPSGAPAAGRLTPPSLSPANGWPFAGSPSSTAGTGRLAEGAFYWTDYVYDDYGARGIQTGSPVASLAAPVGTFHYGQPTADGDGADIFTADVGIKGGFTYWRVDWTTMSDPTIPVAEWAIDLDANPRTGVSSWPYSGLQSPGEDRFLIVHSSGAFVVNAATGKQTPVGPVSVTSRHDGPGSFVVKVPLSVLPVGGESILRLAAGVWDPATVFAPVSEQDGALPGQPPVYNVTFRSVAQEGPQIKDGASGNYQNEAAQAAALATSNITAFSTTVNWNALRAGQTTPDPVVHGYSERWYLTSFPVGSGVVSHSVDAGPGDVVDYPGSVQPYAVYVPSSYRPGRAAPLTWILHSLEVNHNQYGVLSPNLLQEACEQRGSICATTEGRGPDGWYFDLAEADFWQVWNRLAAAYTLSANRTLLTGYSMGGYAAYKLGLTYPDVFAGVVALAGPPVCGIRVYGSVVGAAGKRGCGSDGDTLPLVANAQWLPYVMADGAVDELVPISGVEEQVQAFDAHGERYDSFVYPAEDHLVYATQDGFAPQVAAIGNPVIDAVPPSVDFTWYPDITNRSLGIGPPGDYWVQGISARDASPGSLASFDVVSGELPHPSTADVRSASADAPGTPTPAIERKLIWNLGAPPPLTPVLSTTLSNVAALTVELAQAGFRPGSHGTVVVNSDGPSTVTLSGLTPGQRLVAPGGRTVVADAAGAAAVTVPGGSSRLVF